MKQLRFVILTLTAIVSLGATAQEERIDTVIPKFLINGYFFREMPKLPDATPSVTRLKDKEGNSVVVIGLNVDLPKSVIRQAIPREQVHNADQCQYDADDAETAKRITDKHHFTWTHLVEAKDMMSWIGTEGFPFTVVVDKQGIVRHAVHGTNEEKRAELLAKIKEVDAK